MELVKPRGALSFGSGFGRPPIGFYFFCALCLVIFVHAAPAAEAQTAPLPEADRCALINLSHYYLRCANVNNAVLAFIEAGIKRNPGGASKEQREAAAVMESLVNDFITVSARLYQQAGQQLTPEVAKAREKADEKEVVAAIEWYLSRLEATMKALANKQKLPDVAPNRMMDLCARPKLGQEIRDASKIDARYLLFHQEAKQLLAQNKSCLK